MAYPTTLAFKPVDQFAEPQGIDQTSTTQNHALGHIVHAKDDTYGRVEFIYLKGVASTAKGDVVAYNQKDGTTTRSVAATRGPVAVAMSANVASQFGWYAIRGNVPVSTASAGTGAANSLLAVTSTAGQATVSGTSSVKIDNALCTSAQDGPGAGFTDVQLAYPAANGNT